MSATTISQLAGYKGWSLSQAMRPLKSPWRSFRRRLLRKPGSTLAICAATAFGCAIMTNAVALQTDRHPSPMFTSLAEPRPVEIAAAPIPVPPARPLAAERMKGEPAPVGKDTRARKDELQRTASIVNAKDPVAALINEANAEKTAAPSAIAAETAPARIALIQKALNKAGFGPVKEDGAFGTGTRRALERFEADRKLAVKGEPSGKVLKELTRVTGIAIN